MVIGEAIIPDQLPENDAEAAGMLRIYVCGPLVDGMSREAFCAPGTRRFKRNPK